MITTERNNGKLRQFLVAIFANLLSLSSGIMWGWPSPVIPQLHSSNPPIGDTLMSEEETSWITSLMAIGGLIATPFCGILSERFGRKKFALLTALPHIISWLLIIFAQNHIYLYIARLIGGMGTAMTVFVVPLYVSEISTEDIRGFLGSLILFAINIGILFAYVVGAFLSYHIFACLALLFPLSFMVVFGFMPESAIYLVRQDRSTEAHKSLMFLRENNEALVEEELKKLQSAAKTSSSSSNKITLKQFFSDRATRKGLIISFGLLGGQQLSGIFAMISYAETIFKKAGSSLSADTASIVIGLIQILGSSMSTMLMERAGRRFLTLISCMGMAISHTIVALFFYLQLKNQDVNLISWLPVLAVSTFVVSYCLGIGPVPGIVTSEVFRPDVISFASTICYVFYWAISFASIQAFDVAMQFLGVDKCFFLLASLCSATFVFTYGLVPETKGRDRQDIIDELAAIGLYRKNVDAEKFDERDNLMVKPV